MRAWVVHRRWRNARRCFEPCGALRCGVPGRCLRHKQEAALEAAARAGLLQLFFLDASGFSPSLPPTYTWSLPGRRLHIPHEHPQGRRVHVLTALAALGTTPTAPLNLVDKGISWVGIGSGIRIGGPAPRVAGPGMSGATVTGILMAERPCVWAAGAGVAGRVLRRAEAAGVWRESDAGPAPRAREGSGAALLLLRGACRRLRLRYGRAGQQDPGLRLTVGLQHDQGAVQRRVTENPPGAHPQGNRSRDQ